MRARSSLVVTEVALALVLLLGAGLLIRSFTNLTRVDPGFDPDGVVTMNLFLPQPSYPTADARRQFYLDVTRELQALPGVESAAAVSTLPMSGANADANFRIEGRPPPAPGHEPGVWYRRATAGYLSTMRIEVLRGREITEADHAEAPFAAVINEAMVREHWSDGSDPLSSIILLGARRVRIVGVARDIKNWGLAEVERPSIYIPFEQFPTAGMALVVRSRSGGDEMADQVRQIVARHDPALSAASIVPLRTFISDSVVREQFLATLLSVFAGVALTLAAIGLYGVMAYTVSQRTHEIGIRIALGADPGSVRGLVALQGLQLAAIGLGFGLLVSFGVNRLIAGLLFEVDTVDPTTYVAVPLILAAVAVAASYLPARLATRVDPVEALRAE